MGPDLSSVPLMNARGSPGLVLRGPGLVPGAGRLPLDGVAEASGGVTGGSAWEDESERV